MNVIDLAQKREERNAKKKIEELSKEIKTLKELEKCLKTAINNLTKFQKYSSVKRRISELYTEFKDVQQVIAKKEEILVTLNIRNS
jgi:hypothetical protein